MGKSGRSEEREKTNERKADECYEPSCGNLVGIKSRVRRTPYAVRQPGLGCQVMVTALGIVVVLRSPRQRRIAQVLGTSNPSPGGAYRLYCPVRERRRRRGRAAGTMGEGPSGRGTRRYRKARTLVP